MFHVTSRMAILAALSALALPCAVRAGVLLSDDFSGTTINAAKWTTMTGNLGDSAPDANVTQNDHIVLTNRGHLTTLNQYNPDNYGGIVVTGQWTLVSNNSDVLNILTRSDGVVSGNYGEVANGLKFTRTSWGDGAMIQVMGSNLSIANYQTSGHLTFYNNTVFNFAIIDMGTNGLSFTITQADNAANTITATATLVTDTEALNYVVFYNREKDWQGDNPNRISDLDNVTISTVPEPASMLLMGTGLVGLLWRRRR